VINSEWLLHYLFKLRRFMKNTLKLSLAALAIAALSACGGGGDGGGDVADTYVGVWRSNCNSYTANSGATLYERYNLTLTKTTSTELIGNYSNDTAYADAGCKQALGNIDNYSPVKYNIGAKVTFLGGTVDSMVRTTSTGEARPGFMIADSKNFNVVTVNDDGSRPGGWSTNSPYTKQ
jgi:hypothetical protein